MLLAPLFRRRFAGFAFALLAFAAPVAQAQMSPELLLMLGEMHGKLLTDFATDQRTGQDCRAEVINIANAALKLRGVQSAGEAAGAVLIKALEHSCKAYLDATGLGAIATTYSLAKCGYEYMADVNDDTGFIMCLLGEAIGKGVDKLGDSERILIEESRKVLIGRATDEIVDQAKGLVNDWRNAVGPTETDTTNWTLGDGCEVVLTINWRKASNPVRAMKTQGNAGTIQVHVQIQDCKCSRNEPLHKQLKNGSLFVTVPIRFVPNAAQQPSWQADFPRMRVKLNATCCTGRTAYWGDPPRTSPTDPVTDGKPGGGAVRVPGGGTPTRPPVTQPPSPPVTTPPARPTVTPPPEAPKPPVPMAQACPECEQYVNQINEAAATLDRLRGEEDAARAERARLNERLANIRKDIRRLEQQLGAQRGAGGSSYDPETGITIRSVNNGDGTVTVTTMGPNGQVLETHTRDVDSFRKMRQQLDAMRQQAADTEVAVAAAEQRIADATLQQSRARSAMRVAEAALEKCLEECRRKGVPFDPPRIRVPGGGELVLPLPPKDPPGGTKGPTDVAFPPPRVDPPARTACETCTIRAAEVDSTRAAVRRTEAAIEQARQQMHNLTGPLISGKQNLSEAESRRFGELKDRLKALDTELQQRAATAAAAESALADCNKTCATVEGPKIVVQPPGGGGGTGTGRTWPPIPGAPDLLYVPTCPRALCTACTVPERLAFNTREDLIDGIHDLEARRSLLEAVRDKADGRPVGSTLTPFDATLLERTALEALPGVAGNMLDWIAEQTKFLLKKRAGLINTIHEVELCNRRCATDVEVTKVIGVGGGNPWNPTDPIGTGGGGVTQPPASNPGTLQFSTASYGGGEGGSVLITVTRQGGATGRVSIDYTTQSGTATSGGDFTSRSGALIWIDGDDAPKFITIPLIDDTAVEGPETFSVNLLNVTGGATIGSPSTATVTIEDNDSVAPPQPAGTLQLSASNYSTTEGQGPITITVTRTGGSAGQVGVTLNTGPSSAVGGQDYTPVTITFIWENGDASPKTVLIPILDDTTVEGPETFFVNLNSPTGGATLGAPATATVTINDNDVASGPCGSQGNAWQGNTGATYSCFGSCSPNASSPTVTVNGDIVTVSSFHAGGAATFQGCGNSLTSQSNTLIYFSQANHTATITRASNSSFSANIISSGGGSCSFSCSR